MAQPILEDLYSAERGRLYRLAMRLLRNHGAAEDLVQDAFVRLVLQGDLEQIASREAYVARIVRNLALNRIRDEMRRGETPLTDAMGDRLVAPQAAADQMLIAREDLMRVLGAIRNLPARRREAFVLHRFGELTYDQIAVRMGISRNTVMVQIVNALAELHRVLSRFDTAPDND